MNLLLVGPRGSGKSTTGRAMAEVSNLQFVDLDDRVLARFPEPSVQAIWEAHGEAAWRSAEVEALREVLRGDLQVVALGGGTPMIDAARAMIDDGRARGQLRVIYLKQTPKELMRRLRAQPGDRPSLTGDDPATETEVVLAAREPTYLAVSDVVMEPDGEIRQH